MIQESDKDELILKVLDGIATPDEIQTLARWMETDPSNEVYFDQLKKAWNLTSGPIPSEERVEHELGNYMEYIRSKHRKYSIGLLLKYAAIVMIPLLSVIYWLQLEKDEIPSQMAVGNPGIIPGEHKAMLITAQGQTIALLPSQERDICVQEDFVVKNGQAGIVYQDSKKAVSTLQYNTLKTPRGGEYTVVLSDGTKVYLNAASELKYPVQFDSKKRQVHLSGEAYFNVTKSGQPFVVNIDGSKIRVYGTRFNVKGRSQKTVETVLIEGKIGFKSPGRDEIQVIPGEQVAYNVGSGDIKVERVDVQYAMAWLNNVFRYRDKPLDLVLEDISTWYGVEFEARTELARIEITMNLSKETPIDEVIQFLEEMTDCKFIKERGHYIVK